MYDERNYSWQLACVSRISLSVPPFLPVYVYVCECAYAR